MMPLIKNITVLAYIFVVYGCGVALITSPAWEWNILGVVLLIHSLVLSTPLTHELIHGNLFKARKMNAFWGQVMTHINGACYVTWDNLVEHHLRHHLHHADFVGFDVVQYLNRQLSPTLRQIYVILEWLYFPALEFELRWRIILAPVLDRKKRGLLLNNVALAIYRILFFMGLAWLSWRAVPLYFLSYIAFVNIIRFTDAFHHTYEYVVMGDDFPKRDRVYEQQNTFSNLVSRRYPWLNLLFLNFGYHNAHHYNMSCPWHELPALHKHLYGDKVGGGLLPLPQLIHNYHRFRLQRLFSGQGAMATESTLDTFTGGVAVSLLTPP